MPSIQRTSATDGQLARTGQAEPSDCHAASRVAVLLLVLVLVGGCKRNPPTSDASAGVEQAPAGIEAAFRDAPTEVKQQATEAAAALRSQDDTAAFVRLERLSGCAELTPEQRQAAFNSWMAVNARLQQSAAGGNEAARDLLEKYRASK